MTLGRNSEGAQWTTRCLVQKVASNLAIWSAEEGVAKETATMFVALVQKSDRYVLYIDHWPVRFMCQWLIGVTMIETWKIV